jgi:hypothetical protein
MFRFVLSVRYSINVARGWSGNWRTRNHGESFGKGTLFEFTNASKPGQNSFYDISVIDKAYNYPMTVVGPGERRG